MSDPIIDCAPLPVFPRCPDNRPGLASIGYRIGSYGEIRAAMLHALNREPSLRGWTHREPDDPGIALLEGAAILGDILTFYQEVYANEAFLGTAKWRESVSDLVRLTGYRLTPGVGGRGTFAFELTGNLPVLVPAGFPISATLEGQEADADFETAEALTAYPWLSRFGLYRPIAAPGIDGDTEEVQLISPDWSGVEIEPDDRLLLGTLDIETRSLTGTVIAIVDEVRERHGELLVKFKGRLPDAGAQLAGYKIGRSFRHFGHNAPPQFVKLDALGNPDPQEVSYDRVLNDITYNPPVDPPLEAEEFPLDSRVDDLPVGATVICEVTPWKNTATGLAANFAYWPARQTVMRQVISVRQGSVTWGAMSGASTVLTLDEHLSSGAVRNGLYFSYNPGGSIRPSGPTILMGGGPGSAAGEIGPYGIETNAYAKLVGASGGFGGAVESLDQNKFNYYISLDWVDMRMLHVHETLTPLLRFQARHDPSGPATGNTLLFYGTEAETAALTERPLTLLRTGEDPEDAAAQAPLPIKAPAERRMLRPVRMSHEFSYAEFPVEGGEIVVHGNLAKATQGKNQREAVIGSGDARQSFQTFPLPKSPLTYLTDAGETPPQVSELKVYVAGRLWQRVSSLFAAGPRDEVYIVREDEAGDSFIQFGDNKTGSRLPSGIDNVAVQWRTGVAAFGPVEPGTTPSAGSRLDGLDKVQLPGVIAGGEEAESGDRARVSAPGKVQALGRLVSIADFETEARAIPGVTTATAAWRLANGVPAMVITVLMDGGRRDEFENVRAIIAAANQQRGMSRFPVVVDAGHREYFALEMEVSIDPALKSEAVIAAVKAALQVGGLGNNEVDGRAGRCFGERVYATSIEGVGQNVPGVRWVRVHALQKLGQSDDPATLDADRPWLEHAVLAPAANGILTLHDLHLSILPGVSNVGAGV